MKKGKHYCGLFLRLILSNIIGMLLASNLVHRDESKERGGLATGFFLTSLNAIQSGKKEGT